MGAEWVSVLHSDVSTAQSYGAGARPPTATERPEPLLLHDTRMSAERGRLRKTTNKDAAIKVSREPCKRRAQLSQLCQNSAVPPPSAPPRAGSTMVGCFTIVSCLSCPFLSSDSSLGFEGKLRGSHATLGVGPSSSRVPGEEGRGAAELRTYRRLSGLPGRIRTCCAWY